MNKLLLLKYKFILEIIKKNYISVFIFSLIAILIKLL